MAIGEIGAEYTTAGKNVNQLGFVPPNSEITAERYQTLISILEFQLLHTHDGNDYYYSNCECTTAGGGGGGGTC